MVNALANYAFLTKDTNIEISDREPVDYMPAYQAKCPGAIETHWIPMNPELWKVENYEEFLKQRRILLAKAANELLGSLYAGSLSETEIVPFKYEGGIEGFMQNEVLPYTPDAFINEDKTVIGYELSFTKYFYKPIQLRSLETIAADIRSIEENTDGMLNKILGI